MTIDRTRLIKLLRMTESDMDAEVLLAIRKSNELLRANDASWDDVIAPTAPPPDDRPRRMERTARPGYERSDRIRDSIRREFPITLVFFPVWLAAELVAILLPDAYWNKQGPEIVVAFWSLCGLGILCWLGVGAYLLSTMGE